MNSTFDGDLRNVDYYASYVNSEQRSTTASKQLFDSVRRAGDLVKRVRIGGVDYAELWAIRRTP